MKSKMKIWDKQLFLEGIRQTKWIGIVTLLIYGVLFLIYIASWLRMPYDSYTGDFLGAGISAFMYVGDMLIYYILVPILVIKLFGYLNSRKSADFYHAVPQKRRTVFVSYCTVVLAWVLVTAILWSVETWIVGENTIIYGDFESLSPLEFFANRVGICLHILAGSLLMTGGLSVGLSMSGTTLTTIVATAILLFAPRFVLQEIRYIFLSMTEFLPRSDETVDLFFSSYNILCDFVGGRDALGLCGYDFRFDQKTVISMIYSSLLGIVYLVIGGRALSKRKSETAGQSAVTPFCQHALRIAIAFVCGLPMVTMVAKAYLPLEHEPVDRRILWIWIMITVVVYFLFELFTTKKWKNVLRSAIAFPVVILLLVFTCQTLIFSVRTIAAQVPSEEEITAVSVKNTLSTPQYDVYDSSVEELLRNVEITSEKAIKIVQNQLDEEMHAFLQSTSVYHAYYTEDWLEVAIYQGEKIINRKLHFDEEEQKTIQTALEEQTTTVYDYELPMSEHVPGLMSCNAFAWDFNDKQLGQLYKSLYEEYKEMDLPLSTFLGKKYNTENNVFDFLEYADGKMALPISAHTPKTLELLANIGNEKRVDFDFQWFTDYIVENKENRRGKAQIYLYTPKKGVIEAQSLFWQGENAYKVNENALLQLNDILSKQKEQIVTTDENLLMVLYYDVETDAFAGTTGRWFNVTDEEARQIREITKMEMVYERYKYNSFNHND